MTARKEPSMLEIEALAAWAESDAMLESLETSSIDVHTGPLTGWVGEEVRKAGRPRLDGQPSGAGRAPRRQVRLPEPLNNALDAYAQQQRLTASEIMRDAVAEYLARRNAA